MQTNGIKTNCKGIYYGVIGFLAKTVKFPMRFAIMVFKMKSPFLIIKRAEAVWIFKTVPYEQTGVCCFCLETANSRCMMFTMALWLATVYLFFYIALASHLAAQRKWNTLWLPLVHPALYALGVWLVFPHCAGACILRGLSGRGVRLLGSGLGHEAPPPAPGTAGAEQGFSIERKKAEQCGCYPCCSVFMWRWRGGTAHSGKDDF